MASLINVTLLVAFSVCVWSMPSAGDRVGIHDVVPSLDVSCVLWGRVCNCSVVRCSMENINEKETNVYRKNRYIF